MIQEQAAAAVIIALVSEKNKSKKKKKGSVQNLGFKEEKTYDFMKLCLQKSGQKTNIVVIYYE